MVLEPQYGSACSRMSIPVLAVIFFTIIVAIIVILASAGWPHEDAVTCVLNPTVDLRRIWYVSVKTQVQGSSRSCKTPHNHHHLTSQHHHFCPPRAVKRNDPPLRLPTMMNGQMNKRNLSKHFITHATRTRGHGTVFPCSSLGQVSRPSY
jgi:hypothetical protein